MAEWHPIMAAVEGPTGVWRMIDPAGNEYGRVEIRRVMNGEQIAYKATRKAEVLGWANTLRLACFRVHDAYLRSMSPGPGYVADWGEMTGNGINTDAPRPAGSRTRAARSRAR